MSLFVSYPAMWNTIHERFDAGDILGCEHPMHVLSLWKRLLDPMDAAGMPFPRTMLTEEQIDAGLNNEQFTELYRWFYHHPTSDIFNYQAAADFIEKHFFREHFS